MRNSFFFRRNNKMLKQKKTTENLHGPEGAAYIEIDTSNMHVTTKEEFKKAGYQVTVVIKSQFISY